MNCKTTGQKYIILYQLLCEKRQMLILKGLNHLPTDQKKTLNNGLWGGKLKRGNTLRKNQEGLWTFQNCRSWQLLQDFGQWQVIFSGPGDYFGLSRNCYSENQRYPRKIWDEKTPGIWSELCKMHIFLKEHSPTPKCGYTARQTTFWIGKELLITKTA